MTSVQRDSANETWRNRIQDLHNLGKDEAENAIKAWLRSQHASRPVDFELIGNKFHRWVRNNAIELGLEANDDFADFIEKDFEFYSDWYCRLQQAAQSLTPGLECVYYNEQHNFTLQYPVLLSPLCTTDPETEIVRKIQIVARYLDILIHRYLWNYRSIQQSSMVNPMFSLIRNIRDKNADELAELLHEKLKEDDVTFAHNSRYGLQGNNRAKIRLMLARITDYVETQSGQNSCYQEYIKYDIEHIWANHPEHHEEEFSHEVEFSEYRNRIGGLLLLPSKRNKDFSDQSYEEKLEDYLNENLLAQSLHERTYERNTDFQNFIQKSRLEFRSCSNFKKADLDDRQKLYQQLAKRIWNPARLRVPHGKEPEITFDFDSDLQRGEAKGKVWTINRVRESIPAERREHYETKHKNKIGNLYMQVAELLNLVEEKDWLLTPRFRQSYCALYLERSPIFGVNFFGSPRFAVWISRKEAERLSNHCEFERYDDQHRHAIYPVHALVVELLPIFEFTYSVVTNKLSEVEKALAKARQTLLDRGMTQEEIDALFSGRSS